MEYCQVTPDYVTLLIHRGEKFTLEEITAAVRRVQKRCGRWDGIRLECFPGKGEELVLATPLRPGDITPADYILPFLQEYLTE